MVRVKGRGRRYKRHNRYVKRRLLVFDIAHSLLKHPLITHTNRIHDAFDTAELQGG